MSRLDFDWQIGEERWEERQAAEARQTDLFASDVVPTDRDAAQSSRQLRRLARVAFATIGLIATVAVLIFTQRFDEALAPIRRDVLSAHQFVLHAAAHSDVELFNAFLPPSDEIPESWSVVQRDLLRQAALFDRRSFGLRLQATNPQVTQVDFSPDLNEAEVVTAYSYATNTGYGTTATVRLHQTSLYRSDKGRWLLVSPGYGFWGDSATSQYPFLTVEYPERDRPIARRLGTDLNAVVNRLCAGSTALDCPAGFRIQLNLVKWSLYLRHMVGEGPCCFQLSNTDIVNIELPTPTLVGLPVDEAGYRALYRGYALRVVYALLYVFARDRQSAWPIPQAIQMQYLDEPNRCAWPFAFDSGILRWITPADDHQHIHAPESLGCAFEARMTRK